MVNKKTMSKKVRCISRDLDRASKNILEIGDMVKKRVKSIGFKEKHEIFKKGGKMLSNYSLKQNLKKNHLNNIF